MKQKLLTCLVTTCAIFMVLFIVQKHENFRMPRPATLDVAVHEDIHRGDETKTMIAYGNSWDRIEDTRREDDSKTSFTSKTDSVDDIGDIKLTKDIVNFKSADDTKHVKIGDITNFKSTEDIVDSKPTADITHPKLTVGIATPKVTEVISYLQSTAKTITNDRETYNSENWTVAMEQIYKERMEVLSENCPKVTQNSPEEEIVPPLLSYYVPEYNLIACIIAKCGATTWKINLMRMRGLDGRSPHGKRVYKKLSARLVMTREKFTDLITSPNVTKVISVRHPISRLISAFAEKLSNGRTEIPQPSFFPYFQEILRLDGIDARRGKPLAVTFRQFLVYVLHQKSEGLQKMNNHWIPQSTVCNVGPVSYDYIFKLETLSADLRYLVQKLNITEVNADLKANVSNKEDSSYEAYFKDIPKNILRDIFQLYRNDFKYFGYEVPGFLQPFDTPRTQ